MTQADELAELMPSLCGMIVKTRYGIQHPACEDVTQDIFVACLQSLPKFKGESNLKTSHKYVLRHIFTGWVLNTIPRNHNHVAKARHQFSQLVSFSH